MVIEGQVDTTNSTVDDPTKVADPKVEATDSTKKATTAQGTDPAKNTGWEAEKAAILRDLQKERKARQDYEGKTKQFEADLASAQKRIQALAGVSTPSDEETVVAEVKAKLERIYPWLKKVNEETVDRLLSTAAAKDDIDATTQYFWQEHARKMVSQVEDVIEKEIGVELTKRQKDQIAMIYSIETERDQTLLRRHLDGDKTLVSEFAKAFIEDWSKPLERKLSKQAVDTQLRVPRGKDRSVPGTEGKKIDVTNDKQVEDMLVEGFKAKGGVFGRR